MWSLDQCMVLHSWSPAGAKFKCRPKLKSLKPFSDNPRDKEKMDMNYMPNIFFLRLPKIHLQEWTLGLDFQTPGNGGHMVLWNRIRLFSAI